LQFRRGRQFSSLWATQSLFHTIQETPMPVETAKVQGRRQVAYNSLEEVVADAERLSSGPVKTLGNWSAGQIFKHLAFAFSGSIDGLALTFPWYLRTVARLFKGKLLAGAMPAGYKLSPQNASVAEPAPTSTEQGLAELRTAVSRLAREPQRAVHPLFGALTNEEWNRVHLMHANLHMSFLVPQ
jgi:hypothetical protein